VINYGFTMTSLNELTKMADSDAGIRDVCFMFYYHQGIYGRLPVDQARVAFNTQMHDESQKNGLIGGFYPEYTKRFDMAIKRKTLGKKVTNCIIGGLASLLIMYGASKIDSKGVKEGLARAGALGFAASVIVGVVYHRKGKNLQNQLHSLYTTGSP